MRKLSHMMAMTGAMTMTTTGMGLMMSQTRLLSLQDLGSKGSRQHSRLKKVMERVQRSINPLLMVDNRTIISVESQLTSNMAAAVLPPLNLKANLLY